MRLRIASFLLVLMGFTPAVAGAQGIGLPVTGFVAGGAGLTSFYIIGFELGPWQDYLARELTPDYMLDKDEPPVRVSWLADSQLAILPEFASDLEQAPATRLNLQFQFQDDAQFGLPGMDFDEPW